jgi:hypothetical protein
MSRAIQDATACREALTRLPKLGLRELRQQWRVLYKAEASPHLSRELLLRAVAYRMQEVALGGLRPQRQRQSPTPAVVKRSTSRTWRIVVLSAGIRSPVQKPKERTLIGPAEAPSNRATSSRNGGRNHLGTPSEIKSECWATSSRIRGRLPSESATNRQHSELD